jgi:FK506-binding protein 2
LDSVAAASATSQFFLVAALSPPVLIASSPSLAGAVVTDETDTFADNWWDSSSSSSPSSSSLAPPQSQALPSDEVHVKFSIEELEERGGLGVELAEIEFRTMLRVYVKSVAPGSLASDLGISKDWITVSVNGRSVERTNAKGVTTVLRKAMEEASGAAGTIELVFRDTSAFRDRLRTLSPDRASATTQVAPAGETTQRNSDGTVRAGRQVTTQDDQRVTVTQLVPPKVCRRGAEFEDLLEISYVGRLYETGQIFDGSAVLVNDQGIPGRGNDVSLYFVLGKQPFGQFPPGWDVGLVGMCVGERRRLIIPPALGYGKEGLARRGIPGDATLQYDITLVSLNGLSTPQ